CQEGKRPVPRSQSRSPRSPSPRSPGQVCGTTPVYQFLPPEPSKCRKTSDLLSPASGDSRGHGVSPTEQVPTGLLLVRSGSTAPQGAGAAEAPGTQCCVISKSYDPDFSIRGY